MYQDRQDAVQQIACLGTPLFAFPPIASALIIQVPIYPRPVIRLGEDCPFVSCNRLPSYSEAYRPRRGVARSRLRTEDSKMSESLVSAIGNGLGEPGGRFGFMLSRRAFAEKKVLRCAVFPPVCAWLILHRESRIPVRFAGGCFWSLLRDLRLEERQVPESLVSTERGYLRYRAAAPRMPAFRAECIKPENSRRIRPW